MLDATEIVPRGQEGTLGIHGMDAEQRAVLAFLARHTGKTVDNYKADLKVFHEFCRSHNLPSMLRADSTFCQLYVRWLENRGLAPATINRRIGTLRGFYKQAMRDDAITKDPTLDLAVPRIDHEAQYRTVLTTLEFASLLKTARQDPRSHAMVAALGLLGLRVAEMCSLNVEDVHRSIGEVYITFIGKGHKAARIGLPFAVLHAFEEYLGDRTEGPLFLTVKGDRWTPTDVRRALKTLARRAGIEHHITPHGLRRTLATVLQERGVELGAIQQTLRHKDPRTTSQSYLMGGVAVADIARQQAAAVVGAMAS